MAAPARVHDLPHLHRVLAKGAPAPEVERLCEDGWADPAGFRAALNDCLPQLGHGRTKSLPGGPTDLYADLVERWLGRDAEAAWFPAEGRRLSYAVLHEQATALAAAWQQAGAVPGQSVALVLPTGEAFTVALLAAFQLGMVASFVPPRGSGFVGRALRSLAPDRVASHPRYGGWLGPFLERLLPEGGAAGGIPSRAPSRSHAYAPGAPALRLLSCFSAPAWTPAEVSAEAVLWGALRDGLFVYGLLPGERLALPDFDPLQWQPHGLLSALASGAEWLELSGEALASVEGRARFRPTVAGVTPRLRAQWMAGTAEYPGLRRFVKSPCEPYDWAAWDDFARHLLQHGGARGINLVASAAAGGALLFSVPPAAGADLSLVAVPGLAFMLEDFLGGGVPATGNTGVVRPLEGAEGSAPRVAVARLPQGSTFGGVVEPPWHGRRYPAEAVEEVARAVAGVREAVAWVQASPELLNASLATLLCFADVTGPAVDGAGLARAVEQALAAQLGPEAVPSRVQVYALEPRRLPGGEVDPAWCRWQASGAGLQARARDGLFLELARARQWAGRLAEE